MQVKKSKRETRLFTQEKELYAVHHQDARELDLTVPIESVDVTITSPPYFDLKDYGSDRQIGFGQDYKTYLSDLKAVFQKIHTVTKAHGSLWIIIDSFKRDQELLPLPFDLANELKTVGWSLKDIIIWKKERTLPWTKPGATRNIFEYILVFSKRGHRHQYFPDRLREIEDLKHWWVKYPERYNPQGKSLEEIWSFDIPTQGSWGNGYIRHFCPLPENLVQRIIELTTNPGDVVLDPFSGSGTVPAQALFTGRKYIGFELNKGYIDAFSNYIFNNKEKKTKDFQHNRIRVNALEFEQRIIELRILKMGRLLLRNLLKRYPESKIAVLVEKSDISPAEKFKLTAAHYSFFLIPAKISKEVLKYITDLCANPPLSKYGIQATVKVVKDKEFLSEALNANGKLFAYSLTNSHKYKRSITDLKALDISLPVLSPIGISLNEEDYK
jgi:DNA modification methylase